LPWDVILIICNGKTVLKMHVGYLYDRYLDRKEFLGQGQLHPSKNPSSLGHRKGGANSKAPLSPK